MIIKNRYMDRHLVDKIINYLDRNVFVLITNGEHGYDGQEYQDFEAVYDSLDKALSKLGYKMEIWEINVKTNQVVNGYKNVTKYKFIYNKSHDLNYITKNGEIFPCQGEMVADIQKRIDQFENLVEN